MNSKFPQNATLAEPGNEIGTHNDGKAASRELYGTGIAGLDDIVGGGLARNHAYLIEGDPGTGKTTMAMQFLMEGTRQGQKGLYVTLSESKAELLEIAESHGWSLDGIEVFELAADEERLKPEAQYTVFNPSEVELATPPTRCWRKWRDCSRRGWCLIPSLNCAYWLVIPCVIADRFLA